MKIALVTMRTDPARGGAERYTIDLAEALGRKGHDVSLLAAGFAGVPPGVKTVPIESVGVTRVARYERFLDSLDAHLGVTRYDVMHAMLPVRRCDVYHPHAGLARAMVANDSAITRFLNPRRARVAAVEGRLLESPNPPLVLCLSEYVKRSVKQWYALDEAQLPILFNAVDLQKYDPAAQPGVREAARAARGLAGDECVALFVGHDFERKGLREAVLALGRLRDARDGLPKERLKLLIVGRPRGAKYIALARRLGVEHQLFKIGPSNDVYALYRAANFLVLPTRHDPCSLVVLEGLAMGLPVVSTRFNGACEIMTDGIHGFVLDDPADVDALAGAMRRMADAELRGRMAKACLELRPKLAYENHLRTLLGIYEQVVTTRASRAGIADRYTS